MKEQFSRDKWKQLFYTVSHPSDGYYWIRHQDRGSVGIALLLVVLFSLSFSMNRAYASFIVNDVNPRAVNSLTEMFGVVLLFLILCVSNWSVTCLMNGEGRLKDIVIAVGYALFPIIVTMVLATIASQFLAENEEAFYSIILIIGLGYGAIMMLIGIMQVHNYTLGKTLITLFLTLLALFIIIFLGLLMVDLISKVYNFGHSIYTELIFRT